MICSISGFTTIFPQPRFGRGRMNIPRGESYQHSLGSSAWEGHHVWGKWCATQLCKKCQDKRGMLPFPLEFGIGAMAGTGHFYLSQGVCSLLCESDCVDYVWICFPLFPPSSWLWSDPVGARRLQACRAPPIVSRLNKHRVRKSDRKSETWMEFVHNNVYCSGSSKGFNHKRWADLRRKECD